MLSARFLSVLISVSVLLGCQTNTLQQQSAALSLESSALEQRQTQSRRFDSKNEIEILSACAAVLQDLGFNIDESTAKAGLIVASKDRSAVEEAQVAGQVFLALLVTALGGKADPVWERDQKIKVSVVTKKLPTEGVLVRATFQRMIWNTKDQLARIETINDVEIYQSFFDKLSQSVFLEAHKI